MNELGKLSVPKPGKVDSAITCTKALLGLLPGGGTAAELIFAFLGTPIERRRDELLQAIVEELQRLAAENRIDPESLAANERFVDVVVQVSRQSAATSDAERREYLRNAAVNAAVDETLTDVETTIFLDLIGRYSALHVRCLTVFQSKKQYLPTWIADRKLNIEDADTCEALLCRYVEQLENRKAFAKLIFERLTADGLIMSVNPRETQHVYISGAMELSSTEVSELGKRFLAFIESPV